MCGFVLTTEYPDASRLLNQLKHRGLADPWCYEYATVAGNTCLSHVRLPIQTPDPHGDPERPMGVFPVESGGYFAFVGEVFSSEIRMGDHQEHRVLFEALTGGNPHHLDGFWSAVHVRSDGSARVWTDHVGTKPVYYNEEYGIVASEPRVVADYCNPMPDGEPPLLDEVYLANCIKWGYDYSGRTGYANVKQLPPGSFLYIPEDGGSWVVRQYWYWHRVPFLDNLEFVLHKACRNRVAGLFEDKHPPALLLSGGVDSSLVAAICSRYASQFETFSFPNGDDYASAVDAATHLNLPHPVLLDGATKSYTAGVVKVQQSPQDLGSMVPQYKLAHAIKKKSPKTRVVITGDGADEVFGGYGRAGIYDSQASDIFCELPYYHLPRLDRIHMWFQQEHRSPYLAPSVVAHGLRLPRNRKTNKQALRQLASKYLPDRIAYRDKVPLKTNQVKAGGELYRDELVQLFRDQC